MRAVDASDPPPASSPAPRRALFVAIVGSGMASLDASVVNVALPTIQRELHASVGAVQWMVEAYALLLASLVLVGGALGDRFGRKRVFLDGVILFAASSVACGAAPNAWFLVGARAAQGIGAALLVPGSLALIGSAYEGAARDKAIGVWSSAGAITGVIGPVTGGWVVAHASWRWLFLFNVPLAVLILVASRAGVPESRDGEASKRTDVPGAALVTLALGFPVFALIDDGALVGTRGTIALFVLGAFAFMGFVAVEARSASPMVPLGLFRQRVFAGTNVLTLLLYGALGGALFFLPFELIQIQGYSPTAAGASFLPSILLMATISPKAGALSSKHGPRVLLILGPLIASFGFALLGFLPTAQGGSYVTDYLPGVVALGVGLGLTVAPLTAAVMGSLAPSHAGVASGVNNAVARAAGLLAIAAFGLLLRTRFTASFDGAVAGLHLPADIAARAATERAKLGGADFHDLAAPFAGDLHAAVVRAYVGGFRVVMLTAAVLAALSALGAIVFLRAGAGESPTRDLR